MTLFSNSKKISIIIPCFNREKYIGEAVESCINQRGINKEIIVVDDGSTDMSWNILSSFGKSIKKIKIQNSGPAIARNIGVYRASGTLIKFLDSDDLLLQNSLRSQYECLEKLNKNWMVVGNVKLHDNTNNKKLIMSHNKEIPASYLSAHSIQVSQPLFQKEAFDKVGGFHSSSIAEDYELIFRMSLIGYRFMSCSTPVVFMREHNEDRLSNKLNEKRYNEFVSLCERLKVSIDERCLFIENCSQYKTGLGRVAWSMARRAVRAGNYNVASQLFQIADNIAGRSARKASFPVRLLYNMLDPLELELFIVNLKKLVNIE